MWQWWSLQAVEVGRPRGSIEESLSPVPVYFKLELRAKKLKKQDDTFFPGISLGFLTQQNSTTIVDVIENDS